MNKGAQLVLKTTNAIAIGDYPQQEQKVINALKKAPKIFRDTCEIDWLQPTEEIYNFIRGLSPYPGAWTGWNDRKYKILSAELLADKPLEESAIEPGQYNTDQKHYLYVACTDGLLSISRIQAQGKKAMDIKDFLRGNQL